MSYMTKRLSDHYNRDIAITFGAQLLSFRACFRAEIAQQSAVSQFAKMLIMDYHSVTSTFGKVCTALLLFLTSVTVATAEWSFPKLKLIKTYLRGRMEQERLSCPLKKHVMHHHLYVWKASFGLHVCFASGCAQAACRSWRSDFASKQALSYRIVTWSNRDLTLDNKIHITQQSSYLYLYMTKITKKIRY